MDPRQAQDQLLHSVNAQLVRNRKHEVWRLPNGKMFSRSQTPSDWRGNWNALHQLRKLMADIPGLKLPEIKVEPIVVTVPEPVVADQPVIMKAEAKLATGETISVPVASGPKLMEVTPELAKSWLELNVGNRKLRQTRVDKYKRDLEAGRWIANPSDALVFSAERLLNGQHRLTAVAQSGVTAAFYVYFDAPPEVIHVIDGGAPRTLAEQGNFLGANIQGVAAAARVVKDYEAGRLGSQQSSPYTMQEMLEFIEEHWPLLHRAHNKAVMAYRQGVGPKSHFAAGYAILSQKYGEERVQEFFDKLAYGADLHENSPILRLRSRMRRNDHRRPWDTLAVMFKAWNMHVEGRDTRALRVRENEEFPVLCELPH